MSNYELILEKIQNFIRKFHTNELIRGTILFLSIGLFYFLFTLFIEYFLWLKPLFRTILFWLFIGIELFLLYRFILIPIFRLSGIYKGITHTEASQIIGKYFPDIDDKLLNLIQLHNSQSESELVMASIDQKSVQIKPFKFQIAIDFKQNKKYIKYLAIPFLIWFLIFISGKNDILSDSYTRLVHHEKTYIPPAPFQFKLLNQNLNVLQGKSIDIQVSTVGKVLPEDIMIVLNNQEYLMSRTNENIFSYNFKDLQSSVEFQLKSNEVVSQPFFINVIPTPQIESIQLNLTYPAHIGKANEIIENTGNAVIPEGTIVNWIIKTNNTESVFLNDSLQVKQFQSTDNKTFSATYSIRNDYAYSISTSNKFVKEFENLPFQISVIKDAFPSIQIETDIDSLTYGDAHFLGRISDDYGISKLSLVYYNKKFPNQKSSTNVDFNKGNISDFKYIFPNNLPLVEGEEYEFYFEVFDNDRVNSFKSTKSRLYSYKKDSQSQLEEKLLQEQNTNLEDLNKVLENQQKNQKELDALQQQLKNKSEFKFNDNQKLQELLKRQQQYEQLIQRKTDELKENFDKSKKTDNPSTEEKREDLQKRINELKQDEKEKKLLEELQKLSEKMKKEDLLDKVEKLSTNNKQKEKSLEQLLELTKRFYVEQKMQSLIEKLDELAKKQDELQQSNSNTSEEQEKLNNEFKQLQEDLKQLHQDNKELKEPMPLDEMKPEQQSINEEMEQAKENLDKKQKPSAQKNQKNASNKMKQMSKQMSDMMMEMEGDMIEEDIASLRRIIKNLLNFSFSQEELMQSLQNDQQSVANYANNLKKQNILKTYFEHIDDSLYTLSMRQAKLSDNINESLADAHYYIKQSISSISENQIPKARTHQQFVMTAANDMAALLSSLLDNLQNPPPAMGKGKGKGKSGQSFSLPDIIEKQGDIKERMQSMMKKQGGESGKEGEGKEGNQKGEKQGQGGEGKSGDGKQGNEGEIQSKELYEIYKQQSQLREALEQQLENMNMKGNEQQAESVLKQMEQLQNMMLEKGITNEVLNKLLKMEHELLKLKNATYEQGQEEKRISNTNLNEVNQIPPDKLAEFYKKLNQQEVLNRDNIPFTPNINQKILNYFQQQYKKE